MGVEERLRRLKDRLGQALEQPYVWVLALSVLSGLAYAVTLVFLPSASELRAWTGRLAASLLGSYLTAILVDLNFRTRDRQRQKQIKNTALTELQGAVIHQIVFLRNMYRASAYMLPDPHPESFVDVLENRFCDVVPYLDYNSTYPVLTKGPEYTWANHGAAKMHELEEDIDKVISKYGAFLEPEMLSTFQDLSNSQFAKTFEMHDELMNHRPDDVVPQLSARGWDETVQTHVEAMLRLIQYYEEPGAPELRTLTSDSQWKEQKKPKVGSARVPPSHRIIQEPMEVLMEQGEGRG